VFDDFFSPDYDPSPSETKPKNPQETLSILTDREDPMVSESSNPDDHPNYNNNHEFIGSSSRGVPSLFAPHDGLPGFPAPSGFVIPSDGLAANPNNVELTADGAGFVLESANQENQENSNNNNSNLSQQQTSNQMMSNPINSQYNNQPQEDQATVIEEEEQQQPKLFKHRPLQTHPKRMHPRVEYQEQSNNNNQQMLPINNNNQFQTQPHVHPQQQNHHPIPLHLLIKPATPPPSQQQISFGGRLSPLNHHTNQGVVSSQQIQARLPVFTKQSNQKSFNNNNAQQLQQQSPYNNNNNNNNNPHQKRHQIHQQIHAVASSPTDSIAVAPSNAGVSEVVGVVVSNGQQSLSPSSVIITPSVHGHQLQLQSSSSSASNTLALPSSSSGIPLGMPVPGLLMNMGSQESPQTKISLAQHLATQMLKQAIEDRKLQVTRRRMKRSLKSSDQIPSESDSFPGFPFDDIESGPPVFDSVYSHQLPFHSPLKQEMPVSGSRRRSYTQGQRGRGARRASSNNESNQKKAFGILGSGNFEVIRGGIYNEGNEHEESRMRGHRHRYHEGEYDDTASNQPYSGGEDYVPVMGFQGFDNFQLASNQDEEMNKSASHEEEEREPHQTMSTSNMPVILDSDQDLMATS